MICEEGFNYDQQAKLSIPDGYKTFYDTYYWIVPQNQESVTENDLALSFNCMIIKREAGNLYFGNDLNNQAEYKSKEFILGILKTDRNVVLQDINQCNDTKIKTSTPADRRANFVKKYYDIGASILKKQTEEKQRMIDEKKAADQKIIDEAKRKQIEKENKEKRLKMIKKSA